MVSANLDDDNGGNSGSAYIFERNEKLATGQRRKSSPPPMERLATSSAIAFRSPVTMPWLGRIDDDRQRRQLR